jgi:hypothetical protein
VLGHVTSFEPVRKQLGPQGGLGGEGKQAAANVAWWRYTQATEPPGGASVVSHCHQCRDLSGIALDGLECCGLPVPAAQGGNYRALGIEEKRGERRLGLGLWFQRSMSR